jgi:hypothetical protein
MALSHSALGVYGNGAGVTTPDDAKKSIAAFVSHAWAGTNQLVPGIVYDGLLNIVTGTSDTSPSMTYSVAPFNAILSRGSSYGAIEVANDATMKVNTIAAPSSGKSRYDLVIVWHPEFSYDGVASDPQLVCLNGTATTGTPALPSTTAYPGALVLAKILVPAGVTQTNTGTTITQQYTCTGPANAPIVVPDSSARDRTYPTPVQGTQVLNLSTDATERYYGAYNSSTNPLGAKTAGWYPVGGTVPELLYVSNGTTENVSGSAQRFYLNSTYFTAKRAVGGVTVDSNGFIRFSQIGDYEMRIHVFGTRAGVNDSNKAMLTLNNTSDGPAHADMDSVAGCVFQWEVMAFSGYRSWIDGVVTFSVASSSDVYRVLCGSAMNGSAWFASYPQGNSFVHFKYVGPTRVSYP